MINDPIVEEVHQARAKLLERCGGDFKKLVVYLREREKEHGDLLVTHENFKKRKTQLVNA